MSNHWHIVLWPERDGDLGAFMQKLAITHVRNWQENRRRVGYGHLYQSRYKSFPVENDEHLYQVVRYVERKALRGKLAAVGWFSTSVSSVPPCGVFQCFDGFPDAARGILTGVLLSGSEGRDDERFQAAEIETQMVSPLARSVDDWIARRGGMLVAVRTVHVVCPQ